MKKLLLVICTLAVMAVPAMADWSENFDSFPNGQQMHGVGGWTGWLGDPTAGAILTNRYSQSAPNSVAITGLSDLVHPFTGYTTGSYTFTAWQYIPTSFTGQTYFILLNTYPGAPDQNWSVQVTFTGGMVTNEGASGGTLPILTNQWVELRLEIDLVNDMQTFYYGGNVLYSATWTAEVSGGGALEIAAVDLFANNASPVYYDTLSLVSDVIATESSTWGGVKALFE